MNERTPHVQARTFRWYAVLPPMETFPWYRNRAYPMVMPMKSTRYTSSSGSLAHLGGEVPRVSFDTPGRIGCGEVAAFGLGAEAVASPAPVVPGVVSAGGEVTLRAALSAASLASSVTPAGAGSRGSPAALSSPGSTRGIAGWIHSATATGAEEPETREASLPSSALGHPWPSADWSDATSPGAGGGGAVPRAPK